MEKSISKPTKLTDLKQKLAMVQMRNPREESMSNILDKLLRKSQEDLLKGLLDNL